MAGESGGIREHQENDAFSDAFQAKGRSLLRMFSSGEGQEPRAV
jgi:hypothetical protein